MREGVPALMITYNRFNYTKLALSRLIESDCGQIYVVDNGSTDGTKEWLKELINPVKVCFNDTQNSIACAMNIFLEEVTAEFCIKVDNDTVIPKDFCARMLFHMKHADMVQAKHHIIESTDPGGWAGFTKNMKRQNGLLFHHFIGGSGIMFRRSFVSKIPETPDPLGGWRQFQRQHPELRKAFCEDVSIELLDQQGYTDYPQYYKITGRC